MKKKFFAFMLAFAILLMSFVYINDVSFAQDAAFEIYEDGVLKLSSNDVDDISTRTFETTKSYTIKVLKDLVVPVDGDHLKTIKLNGNITVKGDGHTITGEIGGADGDRLIKIMPGSNVTIDGLKLDGWDKYAGILAKATQEFDSEHNLLPIRPIRLALKNTVIDSCNAIESETGCGGALDLLNNISFTMENSCIKNCKAGTGGAIDLAGDYEPPSEIKIINSVFDGNTADEGGAINNMIHPLEIIDSKIINNKATMGAGIFNEQADLSLIGTVISHNKALTGEGGAPGLGGGMQLMSCQGDNISIEGGEISYNHSEKFGGGIAAEIFDDLTHEPLDYIKINKNVIFKGNTAGEGYFNPPQEFEQNENFTHRNNSLSGKLLKKLDSGKWVNIESVLNNYDIEMLDLISTTTYDSNGGFGDLFVEPSKIEFDEFGDVKEHPILVRKLKETKISNTKRFRGWNTEPDASGKWYQVGQTYMHKGNLYLFAIWEEPVTLTLDENYRGGRVTEKELLVGDAIEPHLYKPKRRDHTFKGWSYNKKRLDKVHYDDRIYEPTAIYAIWDEALEEPEEIKGMLHKAYIFGYPDGTVRPNGEITRAEAAAMLARLLEIESIGSADKPMFPDTPSAWYNKAINAVVQRGIMKGYPDGTFKPNDAITRAEFTQMISTIDNKPYGTAPFADVVGHWAERPIGSEYQAGRILGYPDGTFRPDAHITRCEAAVILNKIFERNFDNMSLLKCKNPQMIKYFIDLEASFWGYNELVEATNTHEYVRRNTNRVPEDWLQIK